MQIGLNQTARIAAAWIGVLLLAPGFAAAQSTLNMTINATYDQALAEDLFAFYSNNPYPSFSQTTQASAVFGPETILVASSYEGTLHQSTAAVQAVVIPEAEAAAFNDLLANWVSPSITVAQIEPNLSGLSTFSVSDANYPAPFDQQLAQASLNVRTSTGSPFYSDGTYSYWASYVEYVEGSLVLSTGAPFTSFDQFTFSETDAVQWMNQMSFSNSSELDITRCLNTWVCDQTTLLAYADTTYLALYGSSSITVTSVPEVDTFTLWLAGLGFVGLAAARRRRIHSGTNSAGTTSSRSWSCRDGMCVDGFPNHESSASVASV